jgi:DNA-binding NarL/FixJ family response regulator
MAGSMLGIAGLRLRIREIKRKLTSVKLVFLTMNSEPEVAAEAFRRGASGYILKHSGLKNSSGLG